ncbi:MAG: hypothetical protein MHM6MM_008005 [Cercozoa sp. M6MM]
MDSIVGAGDGELTPFFAGRRKSRSRSRSRSSVPVPPEAVAVPSQAEQQQQQDAGSVSKTPSKSPSKSPAKARATAAATTASATTAATAATTTTTAATTTTTTTVQVKWDAESPVRALLALRQHPAEQHGSAGPRGRRHSTVSADSLSTLQQRCRQRFGVTLSQRGQSLAVLEQHSEDCSQQDCSHLLDRDCNQQDCSQQVSSEDCSQQDCSQQGSSQQGSSHSKATPPPVPLAEDLLLPPAGPLRDEAVPHCVAVAGRVGDTAVADLLQRVLSLHSAADRDLYVSALEIHTESRSESQFDALHSVSFDSTEASSRADRRNNSSGSGKVRHLGALRVARVTRNNASWLRVLLAHCRRASSVAVFLRFGHHDRPPATAPQLVLVRVSGASAQGRFDWSATHLVSCLRRRRQQQRRLRLQHVLRCLATGGTSCNTSGISGISGTSGTTGGTSGTTETDSRVPYRESKLTQALQLFFDDAVRSVATLVLCADLSACGACSTPLFIPLFIPP